FNQKKAAFTAYEKQLDAKQPEWEKRLGQAPVWETLTVTRAAAGVKATKLTTLPDGSVLASGPNPDKDTFTVTATTKLQNITALRLEVLSDPSLPSKGPGRADNGNFVLNEFTVRAMTSGKGADAKPVELHKAVADFSQEGFPVGNAIDNNP